MRSDDLRLASQDARQEQYECEVFEKFDALVRSEGGFDTVSAAVVALCDGSLDDAARAIGPRFVIHVAYLGLMRLMQMGAQRYLEDARNDGE